MNGIESFGLIERLISDIQPTISHQTPGYSTEPRFKAIGALPMFDEQPKTAEQSEYIDFVSEMILDQMTAFNVKGDILSPERIHFLESSVYTRDVSRNGGDYFPASHSAAIRLVGRGQVLSVLTEEMLHAASYQDYLHHPKRGPAGRRSGYEYVIYHIPFFHGFSEGVVNILKRNLLQKNRARLHANFKLSEEELFDLIPEGVLDNDYPMYRETVESIMRGIKTVPYEIVNEVFIKGIFERNQFAYELIDTAYGIQELLRIAYIGL